MKNFERRQCPPSLEKNWENWGLEWKSKKEAPRRKGERSPGFIWPEDIDETLKPLLKAQTNNHCSYCDKYPGHREGSIDHFKPKGRSAFYLIAFQWENLYFSCYNCQATKLAQYNDLLLRPDEEGYAFNTYFAFTFVTGIIELNPKMSDEQKARAEYTIDIFGLNKPEICRARKQAYDLYQFKLKKYRQTGEESVDKDDFDYRFALD